MDNIDNLDIIETDPMAGPVTLYLASLDGNTSRGTMKCALDVVARSLGAGDGMSFPWHRLNSHVCAMLRSKLAESDAPATANRKLSAVRQVVGKCRKLGRMTSEQATDCIDELKNVKGSRELAGRILTRAEITALLAACANDPTPAGMRDFAIISVLRNTGMRREEVCKLELADIDNGYVTIVGKGNKERSIPLNAGAKYALDQWLAVRGDLDTHRVFVKVTKHGRVMASGFTPQVIDLILDKRASQASVAPLGAHDFRRTFATELDERGKSLTVVQELMGHENISTTQGYIRVNARRKVDAVESLEIGG